MAEEGEICLICHDGILEQPVSALECGHVYHRKCISSWMNQSRGECPQCKQVSYQLRALHFDQTTALLSSNTEIRGDLQASQGQRERNLSELNQQWLDLVESLADCSKRQQQADSEADEAKAQRRNLQEEETHREEDNKKMEEKLKEAQKKCAQTRFYLDEAQSQQSIKLPAMPPRQDDEDAVYERRKLHQAQQAGLRASERAKDVHRQLVSSLKQEAEGMSLARNLQTAAEEVEAQVRSIRAKVEQLRKERSKIQAEDLSNLDLSSRSDTVPSTASQRTAATPPSPATAKVLNVLNRRPATPSHNTGGLKAQDEEDLLLFGGPKKLQRKGSGGFGRAKAPSAPAQVVTQPLKKKSSIKTLFEQF